MFWVVLNITWSRSSHHISHRFSLAPEHLWPTVYKAIDVLEQAEIVYPSGKWRFRQLYNYHIDRLFADLYLDKLLLLDDIPSQNPALVATIQTRNNQIVVGNKLLVISLQNEK